MGQGGAKARCSLSLASRVGQLAMKCLAMGGSSLRTMTQLARKWFPLFAHARSNCENVRNKVSKCIRERSKPRGQESYGDSVGVLEAED